MVLRPGANPCERFCRWPRDWSYEVPPSPPPPPAPPRRCRAAGCRRTERGQAGAPRGQLPRLCGGAGSRGARRALLPRHGTGRDRLARSLPPPPPNPVAPIAAGAAPRFAGGGARGGGGAGRRRGRRGGRGGGGAVSGRGRRGASCPPWRSAVPRGVRAAERGGRRRRRERSCPGPARPGPTVPCRRVRVGVSLLPRGACCRGGRCRPSPAAPPYPPRPHSPPPRCAQVTAEKEARSGSEQSSFPPAAMLRADLPCRGRGRCECPGRRCHWQRSLRRATSTGTQTVPSFCLFCRSWDTAILLPGTAGRSCLAVLDSYPSVLIACLKVYLSLIKEKVEPQSQFVSRSPFCGVRFISAV